ncbi:MAG: hypothetical protein M1820_010583 [Bogoriella megaspora]|nr:MAG: hypothetical protein M1820_010583 [Bogoriella megaspora]
MAAGFLNIPRELRDMIYDQLAAAGAGTVFKLLLTCRQVHGELLEHVIRYKLVFYVRNGLREFEDDCRRIQKTLNSLKRANARLVAIVTNNLMGLTFVPPDYHLEAYAVKGDRRDEDVDQFVSIGTFALGVLAAEIQFWPAPTSYGDRNSSVNQSN